MTNSYDDDELLTRLRAADPASAVPTADPASVARLLEDTMSNDVLTESRESGTHNRGPLTWLVAAAAAVIIAGVGIFAVTNDIGTEDPSSPPAAGGSEPTVTELHAPGQEAYAARCMVPTAAPLSASADVAFEGTVTGIDDGLVTLEPSEWYAGDPTDLVTVEAPSDEIRALLVAVRFEDGGRYLVAAHDDGSVMVCGFSDTYSERLARVYTEAFAR